MIPENAIGSRELRDNKSLVANFLAPDERPFDAMVDYELGGAGLNDPSEGLRVQTWTIRVDGDDVKISADTVAESVLFTRAGVSFVSLAFDQNMRPAVAFVEAGVATLRWFDTMAGAQVFTTFADVITPRVFLDDKRDLENGTSDIILAYVRDGDLYFRAQRDRFTVEYLLFIEPGGTLRRVGMMANNRVGFELAPTLAVDGITFLNALPDGEVGDSVSFAYQVSGGVPPYTYSVVAGALPGGLSLSSDGAVTGSHTTAGSFTWTVQVVDSSGMFAQLAEAAEVSVLGIDGNAPAGIVGAAYSYSYTASGGIEPYSYALTTGALPAGITLNATTGAITGTPTTAGSYTWRVQVTDALGAVATVDDGAAISAVLTITNQAPNIVANVAYSHTYTAAGGAGGNVWLLGGTLPTGITFNAGTATLSGTTTALGDYTFTVQVTDADNVVATLNESVTVSADVPFIITLANGTVIETTGATIQFRDRPGESVTLEDID